MLIEYNQEGFQHLPIRKLAEKTYKILEAEKHIWATHVWGNNTTISPFKFLATLESSISRHYKYWYPVSFGPDHPIIDKPFVYYSITRWPVSEDDEENIVLNFELVFNLQNKEGRDVRMFSVKKFKENFSNLGDKYLDENYSFDMSDRCKRLMRKVGIFKYDSYDDNQAKQLAEVMKVFLKDIYPIMVESLQQSAKEFIKK
jgi:hypothetical protein